MEPASPRERQSVAPPPSSFSSSRPVLSHRRSSSSSTNSIHNRHASFSNDISILDETQPAEPLSSRRLSARLSINASPSSASSTSSHSSRHHSSSDQQNPSSTLKRGTARRASLLQHGLPSPPFTSSDGSGSTRNPPLASELASFQAQSSTDLSPLTLSRRESEKEREEVERQTALSRRDSSSRSSNGSRGSLDFGSRKRSQSPRRSRHPSRTSLVASEEETERSNGARSSSNRRSSNGGSSSFSGFGAEGRTSRTPQDDYPLPPSLTSTRHDRRGSTSSGSSLHAPSRSSLDAGVSPRSSSPLSNQERDPPSSLRTRAVLNRTNTNTSTNSYQSAATSSSSSSSSSSLSRPTSSDHAKRPSLSSRPSETNSISSFHTATSRVRPSPLIPSSPGRPYSPAALASPTASRLRVSPSVRSTRTPLSASTSTLRNKRTTSETSPSLNSLSASTSTARSRRSQALSQHSTPSRDADLASPFTSPRDPREEGRRSLAFENERREVEEAKDEPRARTASGGRSRGRIPVEFTAESGSRASHHAPSPSIGRDSSTPQRPPRRQTLPPFHPPRDGHDEVDSNPSLTLNLNRHDGSSFSNRRSTRTNAPYRAEPLRESGTQPRYLGRGGSAESALANSSTSTIRREEFAFSGRGSDGGHYSPAGTVVNRTRELLERIERENAEAERKRRELAENQAIKRAESSMSFHSSTSQSTTTGATTTRADFDRRFPPRTPGRAYEGSRGDGPRTVGTQPRRPQTVMSFVEDVAAAIPPRTAPPAAIHGGLRSHRSIYNLQSSAEEAPSPSGHLSRSRSTRAATPERFSTMAIRHQHAPLTSSTTRRPMTSMDYVSNGGGSIAMSPSISSFSSITSANIPPPSTSSGSDHHIRTLHSAFTHLSTHYSLSPLPSSPQILSAAQTLLSSATETHQALLHASRLAREQLIDVQVNGVADEVVEGMGVLSGLLKDAVRANDEEVRSLTRLLIALPKVAREAAAGARGGEGPTDDGRSVGRGHERLSSVDERTLSGGGSIRRSGSLRSGMEHGRESSTSGPSRLNTSHHYPRPQTSQGYTPSPTTRLRNDPSSSSHHHYHQPAPASPTNSPNRPDRFSTFSRPPVTEHERNPPPPTLSFPSSSTSRFESDHPSHHQQGQSSHSTSSNVLSHAFDRFSPAVAFPTSTANEVEDAGDRTETESFISTATSPVTLNHHHSPSRASSRRQGKSSLRSLGEGGGSGGVLFPTSRSLRISQPTTAISTVTASHAGSPTKTDFDLPPPPNPSVATTTRFSSSPSLQSTSTNRPSPSVAATPSPSATTSTFFERARTLSMFSSHATIPSSTRTSPPTSSTQTLLPALPPSTSTLFLPTSSSSSTLADGDEPDPGDSEEDWRRTRARQQEEERPTAGTGGEGEGGRTRRISLPARTHSVLSRLGLGSPKQVLNGLRRD